MVHDTAAGTEGERDGTPVEHAGMLTPPAKITMPQGIGARDQPVADHATADGR